MPHNNPTQNQTPTMRTYIQETPQALTRAFQNKDELVAELCSLYKASGEKNICLIACGSSKNAAQCAVPLMRHALKAPVEVVPSATFLYDPEPLDTHTLYVVTSQSGCSTNSLAALNKIADFNHKVARVHACGLTTHLEAELSQFDIPTLDWGAGPELVGYVCKGVVTLVHYLMLFSVAAGLAKGSLTSVEAESFYRELERAPEFHKAVQLSSDAFFERHERALLGLGTTYVVGVGPALGVAEEGALKLGETVKIPAMAYELEEFAHGPNLQMTPAYAAFFVDPLGWNWAASKRTRQLASAYQTVSSQVFLIGANPMLESDLEGTELLSEGRVLFAPKVAKAGHSTARAFFSPLWTLAAFEIFAYRTAEARQSWNELDLVVRAAKLAPTKTKTFKKVMPL